MAESDVLKGELSAGPEDCREGMKDDFKHPEMLYRGIRNRNDTNTDGIFGSPTPLPLSLPYLIGYDHPYWGKTASCREGASCEKYF